MRNTISSDKITVISKSEGAELCSIKSNSDGLEYLWQADTSFWSRHAPVLFPIVGKLKDNKTVIEDETYEMGQHGFARDMNFEVVEATSSSITYVLESSEVSKEKYPYEFKLYIGYKVTNSTAEVSYIVENIDKKNIFFSIGAHPGFNCPLEEGEKFEDYYLEFNKPELIDSYRLKGGVIEAEKKLLFKEKISKLNVSEELFKDDAIMLENMESTELSLRSEKTGRGLTVNYEGFPYLGIWSKPEGGAPFVCLEPWFGIADLVDTSGIYKEKKGIVELEPGAKFSCSFAISIF